MESLSLKTTCASTVRSILLVAGIFILNLVSAAQDSGDPVRALNTQYQNHVARVRYLVSDSKIHFDKTGHLVGKSKQGQWTWHGSVQIQRIEFKDGLIKIRANRLLLN